MKLIYMWMCIYRSAELALSNMITLGDMDILRNVSIERLIVALFFQVKIISYHVLL